MSFSVRHSDTKPHARILTFMERSKPYEAITQLEKRRAYFAAETDIDKLT